MNAFLSLFFSGARFGSPFFETNTEAGFSRLRKRVQAGLRNAKGRRLGRPTVAVDVGEVNELRAAGESWSAIAQQLKVGVGTVYRTMREASKNG